MKQYAISKLAFDRTCLDAEGLPRLLQSLWPGEEIRFKEHGNTELPCPFCGKPRKFSVSRMPYGWAGHCWSCGIKGDVFGIYGQIHGLDPKRNFVEIGRRLSQELGFPLLGDVSATQRKVDRGVREREARLREEAAGHAKAEAAERAEKRKSWPPFVESLMDGCENLAKLRGIPVEGIRLAHSCGTLRFMKWRNLDCWVLSSPDRTCAEARRMDGNKFVFPDGREAKTLCLPGSLKKGCLIGEHLLGRDLDPCFLVEGAPDWLSACWLTWFALGRPDKRLWLPLGLLGAECNLTPNALEKLRGRVVRVFVHADSAGEGAAQRWLDRLRPARCTVEWICVGKLGLTQTNGKPAEDLNDVLRASAEEVQEFAGEVTR